MTEPLEILYQDEDLVAVDKPAGLFAHPSRLDTGNFDTLHGRITEQLGQKVYFIHRLDRPTSGVMLLALNKESVQQLAEDFREHRVHKQYLAIARGFCPNEGHIDRPLQRQLDRIADKRSRSDLPPQDAITDYKTLERYECPVPTERYETSRFSLVQLFPKTGRKHQLRRHLKHLAHPIVGDRTHGDHRLNKRIAETYGVDRMMLVAERLAFTHPKSGDEITIEASVGSEFQKYLGDLRKYQILSDPFASDAILSR